MFLDLCIFLTLVIDVIFAHGEGIQTFHKEWIFHEKEIILSRDQSALEVNSVGEIRFLYALCEDNHWKPKKICDIIMETYTLENFTYKSICKINLETDKENRMVGRNFILRQLGTEKAIFMWLDREKNNWAVHKVLLCIRVINWSTCQFTNIKLPIQVQNELVEEISCNNVIVNNDTFDVFFYSNNMCKSGKCKVTYDANGKRIGNVESFFSINGNLSLSLILPVTTTSLKGYYAFSWISGHLTATLIDIDQEIKSLMNIHVEGYITFGISNDCDTFGLCWLPLRGDSIINCVQIDPYAQSKLNISLNFGYKVMFVRILNLSNGGFLLLQLACTDRDCIGYKTFYISRIYADGHHDNKLLEINGLDVDLSYLDRYKINLFKKSKDIFCITVAGPVTLSEYDIITKEPRLTYTSKCFHKRYVL